MFTIFFVLAVTTASATRTATTAPVATTQVTITPHAMPIASPPVIPTTKPTSQAAQQMTPIQVIVNLPRQTPPKTLEGISDGLKIALTALLAVATFVVGQWIQRLFIEPIQEQRKIIGRIAHAIVFYTHEYKKDVPDQSKAEHEQHLDKASEAILNLASELRASISTIPFYYLLEHLHLVTHRASINIASNFLMRWRIRMTWQQIYDSRIIIKKQLNIDLGEDFGHEELEKINADMERQTPRSDRFSR